MENKPEAQSELKERKERKHLWSRLGVIALASSMAAACVEKSPTAIAQANQEKLAEQGMRIAGEDAQIQWETETRTDEKGYTTGETLHAYITSRGKMYRVDLDLGPVHAGMRGAGDNLAVPAEGFPVSDGSDPTSVSWYDMDANGNGLVVKFIPLRDKDGNDAIQSLVLRYENGKVQGQNSAIGYPNVKQ